MVVKNRDLAVTFIEFEPGLFHLLVLILVIKFTCQFPHLQN